MSDDEDAVTAGAAAGTVVMILPPKEDRLLLELGVAVAKMSWWSEVSREPINRVWVEEVATPDTDGDTPAMTS